MQLDLRAARLEGSSVATTATATPGLAPSSSALRIQDFRPESAKAKRLTTYRGVRVGLVPARSVSGFDVAPVFDIVTGEPFKQSAELTGEPIKMKA